MEDLLAKPKERWASRLGLVLAMAGNAVGLGNFLRFPAQAVANGGGAFMIPYLVALLVMGIPLIWVEWAMGRYGGQHGHHSSPGIFDSIGTTPIWKYLGVFGLWVNLMIAAYYLYIESWTMAYAGYSILGGFADTDPSKFYARITGTHPTSMFAFSVPGIVVFALCIGINVVILSRGLAKGIELVSKVGMPLLIGFAALLAVRGLLIVPEAEAGTAIGFVDQAAKASPFEGLNFLWTPRFDSLTNPAVWLAAAGQIFFTLSIGMGSIHCYASYLRETDDIALTGSTAAWTNEFCEVILGGTILIPIAVAYLGLEEVQSRTVGGSGFGLGFMTFPTLFQNWGTFAPAAGFLWFGLLFFAAITSSLAMGQPILAFLQTEFGFTREKSALAFGALLLPLAACVAFLHEKSFFDEFDYWAGTFSLVVFALIETVLFAWVFGMDRAWAEIAKGGEIQVFGLFYYVIKYVTPTFLILIMIGYTFQPEGRIPVIDKDGKEVIDPITAKVKTHEKGWEPYFFAPFNGRTPPAWDWSGSGMIGKLLFKDLEQQAEELQDKLNSATSRLDPEQREELQKQLEFLPKLRMLRTIDRLVMVGMFVFFCVLVAVAWNRRKTRERGAQ